MVKGVLLAMNKRAKEYFKEKDEKVITKLTSVLNFVIWNVLFNLRQ